MRHYLGMLSLALAGALVISAPCSAQDATGNLFDKTGQAGVTFLKIGTTARAAGMGDAFSSTSKGAASAFHNPGGLGFIRGRFDATIAQVDWVADIGISSGAIGVPVGPRTNPYFVAALSFITMDYGTIYGTVINTDATSSWQEIGTLDPTEVVVGLSVARQFTDKFSLGLTVKYLNQALPWYDTGGVNALGSDPVYVDREVSAKTAVFDAGTMYRTGLGSSVISMSIRNFARTQTYELDGFRPPITFQIGLMTDLFDFTPNLQEQGHRLLVAADGIHPPDHPEKLAVGGEYSFRDLVFLRSGYSFNSDARKLSLGFGMKYTISGVTAGFDYAYADLGSSLGKANFITLNFAM